jgi:hypothetical protein
VKLKCCQTDLTEEEMKRKDNTHTQQQQQNKTLSEKSVKNGLTIPCVFPNLST